MPNPPIEVAAAVIVRQGCVLVCRRAAGGPHPGKFEFPGGKREAGESLPECLRRELEEELGVVAEIGALLWRTDHQYEPGRVIRLSFFAVLSLSGEIRNRVFASIHWCPLGELGALDFLAADIELAAALMDGRCPH